MIKPNEIRTTEFDMSVIGGYKRESVDVFFNSVVNDYEKLYNENSELVQKLKVCIEKIEEYQKDEKFLKAAIINAEKLNENSLKDIEAREKEIENAAKEKASNIIETAKIEAENILKTARIEAAEAIRICEIESAEKISEINAGVEIENEKLQAIKKEVSDFKESVLKLYKEHLNSLSKLPEFVPENKKSVAEPVNVAEPSEAEIENEVVSQPETVQEVVGEEYSEDAIESEQETSLIHDSQGEKTAEFVIDKKADTKDKTDTFEKNFKFQGLKFGADFDIRNDK